MRHVYMIVLRASRLDERREVGVRRERLCNKKLSASINFGEVCSSADGGQYDVARSVVTSDESNGDTHASIVGHVGQVGVRLECSLLCHDCASVWFIKSYLQQQQ